MKTGIKSVVPMIALLGALITGVGGVSANAEPLGKPPIKPTTTQAASLWLSGVGDDVAKTSAFGAARGEQVQIIKAWGDTDATSQAQYYNASALASWRKPLVLSVGGITTTETWAAAATGAYDARWKTAAARIRALPATLKYVVIAHEMNGTWMPWSVTSKNLSAYKQAHRRYVGILRAAVPGVKIVWSPNSGTHSDVTISQMWPGNDVVDVVGVSFYGSSYFPGNTQTKWDNQYMLTKDGSPWGLGAWQAFAVGKGKPIGFPEWGLRGDDPAGSDNPVYIKNMCNFMTKYQARQGQPLAGRVLFDTYFNAFSDQRWSVVGGMNPASAGEYKKCKWGQ